MNNDIAKEFRIRLDAARRAVSDARISCDKLQLANALKELGTLQGRQPHLRDYADHTFREAAEFYLELQMPLEAAWVIRHIGINQEYAERLDEAERYYDDSLALFRRHASDDDPNYANTVRYPAVIKNRVGKREESRLLWEEAVRRYAKTHQNAGVAEGAAWLAIFAFEKRDTALAQEWLESAETAAAAAGDGETKKWIDTVRAKISGDPISDD